MGEGRGMRPYELYEKDYSFIREYVEWARKVTDASLEFHVAAAFSLLAAVCGNQVTYPGFGGTVCWPNLYTVLVGASGISRKSTVVRMVDSMLSDVDPSLVIRGEQSREAFLTALSNHPVVLLPLSEFASTLSLWKREYQSGFRECVTDLYDPYIDYRRQLVNKEIVVSRPALNILAGSTFDWLRESLTGGDLRGGFMGRFLIFPAAQKEPDAGISLAEAGAKRSALVATLKAIYKQGPRTVRLTEVKEYYNMWLRETEQKLALQDDEMVGFFSRVGAHCLKMIVLDTIASAGPTNEAYYEPHEENLNRAISLSQWLINMATDVASNQLNVGTWEMTAQRILVFAGKNGGIARQDLLRKIKGMSSRKLDEYINTLKDREEIEEEREQTSGRTRLKYRRSKGEGSPIFHEQTEDGG